MRHNCCHDLFASILKFLTFVQALVGVSIILYSVWMLHEYKLHEASLIDFASSPLGSSADHKLNLRWLNLPAPWFIYSFMVVGTLVCIVTFIGFIAAEAINRCCLCFYSILKTLLILLEAALVGLIFIDRQWEKDLPYDPTGELHSVRAFIEEHIEICKWVGVAVVAVQLLALLLAMVLIAMVSNRKPEFYERENYENPRSRIWGPHAC